MIPDFPVHPYESYCTQELKWSNLIGLRLTGLWYDWSMSSTQTFQWFTYEDFDDLKFHYVYLDDILMFSTDEELICVSY